MGDLSQINDKLMGKCLAYKVEDSQTVWLKESPRDPNKDCAQRNYPKLTETQHWHGT